MTRYLLCLLGLPACEPRAAIVVSGRLDAAQIDLINCMQAGQILPLKDLTVTRVGVDQPVCTLAWTKRSGPGLGTTWRYGDAHSAYTLTGCGPLVAGATYKVRASMGPSLGMATFTVDPSGAIATTPGCD